MLSDIERFKALPQSAQDAILEKHRDWNVNDSFDWWEGVYEQFIETMTSVGIEVSTRTERTSKKKTYERPAIFFSGFWSQGDGACFQGRVSDWNLVLTLHDFPLLMQHREEFETMQLWWESSGNYCHEYTLSFEDGETYPLFLDDTFTKDKGELRQIAARQLQDELVKEWDRFKKVYEEVVKNYCRELYHNLEKEYEYLTEDDTILDSLSANDMLIELIEEYESENQESESA